MKAELIARLTLAVAELRRFYDCGHPWLPEIDKNGRPIDRLCFEIRALGEELFRLGGVDAMQEAIDGVGGTEGSRFVAAIWRGIGGAFRP
jgi:hypothetical protein